VRHVVTGANRGIGLELVRQLAARGELVEACARTPSEATELAALASSHVRIHPLDVTDAASVRALAAALGDASVDTVFNVAGVSGRRQSLGQMAENLELGDITSTVDVNATGALRVAVALLPHVRRGTLKKLVHVTSGMGSISDNTSGGYYAYRMSKAALNMMSKSLAVDLKSEDITSIVINPGWVQTAMGGANAPMAVDESVRGILQVVDAASPAVSGEFFNWNGNRYPW
jgi:NAD(P)-dependent dehydrogenase (short-subunit alcohol dehydrogenase family)